MGKLHSLRRAILRIPAEWKWNHAGRNWRNKSNEWKCYWTGQGSYKMFIKKVLGEIALGDTKNEHGS